MRLDVKSNKQPISVTFGVIPSAPTRVRIFAIDPEKPMTVYTDRYVNLKGAREFELKFPTSPDNISVFIQGVNGQTSLQTTKAKINKTTPCGAWMDSQTSTFVRFAEDFCEKSSYMPTGVYQNATGQYTIKYLPTIVDYKSGKQLNTPARIGHETGNIEVAKDKWMKYSVPMRMIILLHEYSHKYLNHQVGRHITDEVAADINALYIYLGLGYPAMDARLVFANVFYGHSTDLNKRRMNIIDDFITRFQKGEVIKGCK